MLNVRPAAQAAAPKFWQMHDILFTINKSWETAILWEANHLDLISPLLQDMFKQVHVARINDIEVRQGG